MASTGVAPDTSADQQDRRRVVLKYEGAARRGRLQQVAEADPVLHELAARAVRLALDADPIGRGARRPGPDRCKTDRACQLPSLSRGSGRTPSTTLPRKCWCASASNAAATSASRNTRPTTGRSWPESARRASSASWAIRFDDEINAAGATENARTSAQCSATWLRRRSSDGTPNRTICVRPCTGPNGRPTRGSAAGRVGRSLCPGVGRPILASSIRSWALCRGGRRARMGPVAR
jgi:hypothetical protein